jgi:hypothetical protein
MEFSVVLIEMLHNASSNFSLLLTSTCFCRITYELVAKEAVKKIFASLLLQFPKLNKYLQKYTFILVHLGILCDSILIAD